MVLSALIVVALGQGSLFQQVIPKPTGKNGYEELVRACDVLRDRRFGAYFAFESNAASLDHYKDETSGAIPPEIQSVYDALKGKSLLQRRRWALERYAPAVDLFNKAAEKPIFDPRTDFTFATLFPELAHLKEIAKFIPVATYVYFADGKNAQGTNLLMTGLDVYERISYSTLIHYLVGIACQAILLANIEQHLQYFNQTDAKKLGEASLALLERPTAAKGAVVDDARSTSASVEELIKKPSDLVTLATGLFQDEDAELAKDALGKMTDAAKGRLVLAVKHRYEVAVKEMAQKYDGPESDWVTSEDPITALKPNWKTEQGIADAFTDALMPVYSQIGITAARSRTQIRLLGLVASVIRYRWEHNQLPTKLEDAVGKERLRDPLSQLPFELRRDGATGFSVISKGTKETGEIALRYRRQTNNGNPGPP